MSQSNKNLFPNTRIYFQLSIEEGARMRGVNFQEASGMGTELSVEQIVEGGENQYKYRLPNFKGFQNLILKRGFMPKDSEIFIWVNKTLTDNLASVVQPKNLQVSLFDANNNAIVNWQFIGAYPVKMELSDFKSQGNEVAVESLEFKYNYLKKND